MKNPTHGDDYIKYLPNFPNSMKLSCPLKSYHTACEKKKCKKVEYFSFYFEFSRKIAGVSIIIFCLGSSGKYAVSGGR